MPTPLPEKYKWLEDEGAPKMLVEALKHHGELEHPGNGNNPNILKWAMEVGVSGWYREDEIPWCGLFVGLVAKRCGYPFAPRRLLASKEWVDWGEEVPKGREMLWDVLIFTRPGGGHIGFYVGESEDSFLVYGGNQSNKVGFTWIRKNRHIATRRPLYAIGEPNNVRKVYLDRDGNVSENEQ